MSALVEATEPGADPSAEGRPDGLAPDRRTPPWGAPLDLLVTFADARSGALAAGLAGNWLDAALMVAGCSQIVEDHLHRSEGLLDRMAVHLTGSEAEMRPVARAADLGAAALRAAHHRRRAVRSGFDARDRLLDLSVDLAAAAVGPATPEADADELCLRIAATLGVSAAWPGHLDEVPLRLPSSFRSFDQHPADMAALAERYAAVHPHQDQPVLVAGIRTSGSYLGPFVAAALRELGFASVGYVTLRAGERLDTAQGDRLAAMQPGRVVLVDDPPVSGGTIRDCIRTLEAAGAPGSSITLLLALPDGWELAPFLDPYEQITLPGHEWHLTRLLRSGAAGEVAERLLADAGWDLVSPLVPTDDPVGAAPGGAPRTPREHGRVAYATSVVPREAPGPAVPIVVVAHPTGIGFLGRHDAAVAAHLPGLVPQVLGVEDGVLYELVGGPAAGTADDGTAARPTPDDVARYVLGRHRATRVAVDRAATLEGDKAVWEVAAMVLGGALGRADAALRLPLLHPLVKSLLAVGEPSVVDGRMTTDRWVPMPRPETGTSAARPVLVKSEPGEGAFSNRDLWSYDATFDLAAGGDELGDARGVRAAWGRLGGAPVEPSRWLLHRLVHAWDRHRLGALSRPDLGRAVSAALADHVGDLFLDGLAWSDDGPWVAVDVDGVLETGVLMRGTAPGLAGGAVLRTLAAHGYRLVPATGRSVGEVADRVAAWGLPGGVAEYGTALVLPGEVVDLRTDAEREAVERARTWLAAQPGIEVDAAHVCSVRAWRTDGGRGPLTAADVRGACEAARGAVVAVPGEDQVDLVPAATSKDRAVRELLRRLDPARAERDVPLALSAGDGPADAGLLGLGRISVVPAHATPDLRARATVDVVGAYQAGLAEGVGLLVGHQPGGCDACRVRLDPGQQALMTALSVREAGAGGIPVRLARLARQARRATLTPHP